MVCTVVLDRVLNPDMLQAVLQLDVFDSVTCHPDRDGHVAR